MKQDLTSPQWDGRGGWYEVYFVIVTDPAQRAALWLRWLLVAPEAATQPAMVSLWAMGCIDGERVAYKEQSQHAAPTSVAAWQSLVLPIIANKAYARLGGGALVADLQWEPAVAPQAIYPYPWMYRQAFPKSKLTVPVPQSRAQGTIQCRGRNLTLTDAIVSVGHFWGTQMAESWVWAQAPQVVWDTPEQSVAPHATFEAFTAHIAVGPLVTPALTLAALDGACPQRWTHPLGWARQQSVWTGAAWHVVAQHGAATLEYTCTADPATIIGVTYVAPDGSRRYCYHSDLAQLRGSVRNGCVTRHFTASDVRFETVARTPNPDLALLL